VNAGAVSSYVLSCVERTNYLSELCQGDTVTGVRVSGETRPLVVGRVKIETRPLLLVKARSQDGDAASIMLQNDWHVRMLGPGGLVHNITELKAGSVLLGRVDGFDEDEAQSKCDEGSEVLVRFLATERNALEAL